MLHEVGCDPSCRMLQGSFVEAASPSLQMVQISATILELIKAPAVHAHSQAYVRRCALVTASKVSQCHNLSCSLPIASQQETCTRRTHPVTLSRKAMLTKLSLALGCNTNLCGCFLQFVVGNQQGNNFQVTAEPCQCLGADHFLCAALCPSSCHGRWRKEFGG